MRDRCDHIKMRNLTKSKPLVEATKTSPPAKGAPDATVEPRRRITLVVAKVSREPEQMRCDGPRKTVSWSTLKTN